MDNKNLPNITDEEIDLRKFFYSLLRNKNLILKFSISGFLLGCLIAFSSKKVWEGEFQIVLESNQTELPVNISSNLADLAGIGGKKETLKTEVGILKSPSVLMKVFQFVKNERIKKGDNSIEKKGFRKWMESESVKINLVKKTSILDVSYRDKDKDLILPVLEMISSRYQEYSEKKRNRNLELAINYFEDQIPIYKVKSLEALERLNQFAIDNDLSQVSIDYIKNQPDTENKRDKTIEIEVNRISAANQIRVIEQQLEQLKSIREDNEQIISFGEGINEVYNSKVFKRLKEIDNDLVKDRISYKDNDIYIKNLLKERKSLIIYLRDQIKNNLISKRREAYALKKSSERPDGVLTTYIQLMSKAKKESNTLFTLEKQYRTSLLEKARSTDPWELITTPTLYPYPVAPSKKLIAFLFLVSAGIVGIITSLILEKKRDLIYSISDLDSFVNWSFTSEFLSVEKSYIEESLKLIAYGQLRKNEDEIAFLVIGNIDESIIDRFSKSSKIIFPNKNILLTKNFFEAYKYKNIIGLIKLGTTKNKDFILSLEKINLQKRKFLGLLVINNLSF